ncbi:MAG: hypothetical protein FGM14_11425 [Flavobacteriales bacterium]|nr:hypothetical protein [Flavobacteriales bacterium]
MNTLFDELGDFQPQKKVELKITAKEKTKLTKDQQAFNRLITRIQNLEKSIESDKENADLLFNYFEKEVRPQIVLLAEKKVQFAVALNELTNRIQLSNKVLDQISDLIVYSLDEAFEVITPTQEIEDLYDDWSETPYQDILQSQKEEVKDMFEHLFKDMFGKKVDLDGVDMDDPESVARFQAKMKSVFEAENQYESKKNTRKKSKREQQLEEQEKAAELIKNKSLRSIYISLSKVLHPDTETDEELKSQKMELMKSVTIAYEQKDLKTLLRLEMEWVYKTSEHLEQLAADKLKIYTSVLKERVSELEMERQMILRDPRYFNISNYITYSKSVAMNRINNERLEMKNEVKYYEKESKKIDTLSTKKQAKEYVSEIYEIVIDDFMEDFLW